MPVKSARRPKLTTTATRCRAPAFLAARPDQLWRPFPFTPHSFALSLSSCAPNTDFARSFLRLVTHLRGLASIDRFYPSVEAHPHVAFAMRFFSPAQALAALSLLSLSTVRLHVGALQLDPLSPGKHVAFCPSIFWSLMQHRRLDQRCFLQNCKTAGRAVCDRRRERCSRSRRLSRYSVPAVLLVAGRCYVRYTAGLLALHGRRSVQQHGARGVDSPVWRTS